MLNREKEEEESYVPDELFWGEQHTLKGQIEIFGTGLFTGKICIVKITPAPPNTGIIFRKDGGEEVKVSLATVDVGFRNLFVRTPEGPIFYVEHLLSAFFALGVDNAFVDVRGDEIPFFDGSALFWSERILQIGLEPQQHPRPYAVLTQKVKVREGDGEIEAEPSGKFEVEMTLERKGIPKMSIRFSDFSEYPDNIAPARTFALASDAHLARNFMKGFSPENTVIFENGKPKTKLVFPDEPIRHKLLDFLGDLYSFGMRVVARFRIKNPSHSLTRAFLKQANFQIIT